MATRMQQRRGTAEQWESVNPVLAAGEIGFETDTNKFKIGDGVNDWETLVYFLDADSSGGQVGDFIPTSQKAQPDGVATLDVNGQVPANQLGNASVDLSGYATEGYVDTAIGNVVGLAPETLNTLSELADALGDDPDAITTLQSDVAALQASGVGGDFLSNKMLFNPSIEIASSPTVSADAIAVELFDYNKIRISNSAFGSDNFDITPINGFNLGKITLSNGPGSNGTYNINSVDSQTSSGLLLSVGNMFSSTSGNYDVSISLQESKALSPTEIGYLDGVSGNIQDQLDALSGLQSDISALQTDKADLINGFVDPSQLKNINLVESKFVAVQSGTDNTAYSDDGITWTQAKMPSSSSWISVVFGNGRFLATSFNYVGAYSTNGITWIQSDLPTPSFSSSWRSTAYGNDKFVALDFNNSTNSAYSTDAITWTVTTMPAQRYWNPIAYGDGKFVAVAADSTTAAYSTNGIAWTQTSMPVSRYWDGVVYGNDKFVAIARSTNVAAYSTNGISWTQSAIPGQSWDSVTYGNGKFVAVADFSNVAAYSTNGITWTQATMPSYNYWASVTYGNDKFVAIARNSTASAYSTDGIAWTQSTLPTYETWHSVAHGVTSITSLPIASENYVNSEIESINLNKADTNSPTFTGLTDFEGIVDFSEAVILGIDALPNQNGNSGKYLTTNGNVASWQVIPAQTPHPFSMIG
jgi:hypothetical protein